MQALHNTQNAHDEHNQHNTRDADGSNVNASSADASTADAVSFAVVAKPKNGKLVSAALRLLARRDFTIAVFTERLLKVGFEAEEIAEVAIWCQSLGWLNEERFVEQAVNRLSKRYGASRISRMLVVAGVPTSVASAAMPEVRADEFAPAYQLWQRKFREYPIDQAAKAKQSRFLQAKGFSFDTIKQVFNAAKAEQEQPE
jgi:regulatory protein